MGKHRENIHPGISLDDASILCIALGGDNDKDFSPVYVGGGFTEFASFPPQKQ